MYLANVTGFSTSLYRMYKEAMINEMSRPKMRTSSGNGSMLLHVRVTASVPIRSLSANGSRILPI